MNKEQIKKKLDILEKNAKRNLELVDSIRELLKKGVDREVIDLNETDFNVPGLLEGLANSGGPKNADC